MDQSQIDEKQKPARSILKHSSDRFAQISEGGGSVDSFTSAKQLLKWIDLDGYNLRCLFPSY